MKRLALLLPLAACGPGAPDRALPGPCGARIDVIEAIYGYDDADRLVHVDWGDAEGVDRGELTYEYGAGGALQTITTSRTCDLCEPSQQVWVLDAEPVTRTEGAADLPYQETFEPSLRFWGDRFELGALRSLRAPDSLLSHTDSGVPAVTYTYDGPARTGSRVRTGSDGTVETFTYDADGNLVHGLDEDFGYEDGLLVQSGTMTLERDEFGNLLRTRAGAQITTYGYSCW